MGIQVGSSQIYNVIVTSGGENEMIGVDVKGKGALGDGSHDDTSAVQSAVNEAATSTHRTVYFPPGGIYKISAVTLPNAPITILAHGATIQSTSAGSYVFTQTARNLVRIIGAKFTGVGNGLSFNMAGSESQSFDIHIQDCSFVLPSGKTALSIVGAREGVIRDCYFETCTGVYIHQSVNIRVSGSQFKNCDYGVRSDGQSTGDSFDAGTQISDCTMVGCTFGVESMCWDYLSVINCMIDYCDQPIRVTNNSSASIVGNYISSRDTATTSSAPIQIVSNGSLPQGGVSQHIVVTGNQVICHGTLGTVTGIDINGGIEKSTIRDNQISFWLHYGVRIRGAADMLNVTGNILAPASPTSVVGSISLPGTENRTYLGQNYSDYAIVGAAVGTVQTDNFTS
jgi:polygalacturonase